MGGALLRLQQKFYPAIFALVIVLGTAAMSATGQPRSAEWTHYRNGRWAFCVDYPAQWEANELKDGSGVMLYPDRNADPDSGPYVSISAVLDQPDFDNSGVVFDDSPPPNLEGNFARMLQNLRVYDHASDIRVLEKRALEFQNFDALRTSIGYRTVNGADLADETLWINREYVIVTATLLGQPDRVRKLESVYRDIVMHRFQLVCPAKR